MHNCFPLRGLNSRFLIFAVLLGPKRFLLLDKKKYSQRFISINVSLKKIYFKNNHLSVEKSFELLKTIAIVLISFNI